MKYNVKKACADFIVALGKDITDTSVFITLAEVAEKHGLELQAHQRGIAGTFICFVKG